MISITRPLVGFTCTALTVLADRRYIYIKKNLKCGRQKWFLCELALK